MKIRLHVAIAHSGITSRRKAEQLIAAGNVQVNGKTIKEQGTMVDPEKDTIVVNGQRVTAQEKPMYFLLHKQRGVVSTSSDPDGKRTVLDVFRGYWKKTHGEQPLPRLYPVGRLDEDSEGLILLTNDGDLAYTMTHPKFETPKTYEVMISGTPGNAQLGKLQMGVKLKEGFARIDAAKVLRHDQGNTWLSITIHQGMHHQIRRTLAALGLEVKRLIRVSLGSLKLGDLKLGATVEIEKPLSL